MANEIQTLRLEKRILELTSELFYREMKDNDIGFVTFTGCTLNSDLSVAKIGVSVYATEAEPQTETNEIRGQTFALKALQKASGFFRSRIGKALRLRISPKIEFFLDDTFEKQAKIDSLIDSPDESLKDSK